MRGRVVLSVARATLREFWRTPEAVFWSFGFPLAMALVLGMAFSAQHPSPVRVLVVGEDTTAAVAHLALDGRLDVKVADAAAADRALTLGAADVVVLPGKDSGVGGYELRFDPTRPDAELADLLVRRALQAGAGRVDPAAITFAPVSRPGSRYIDFLVPGLVGLNLMGMGLFGVGFTLVQMRVRRSLRRLSVTPMGHGEFFVGFLATRIALAVPAALAIVAFGVAAFGVPIYGSWSGFLLLVGAGGVAFSGLGALAASRVTSIEGASGIMNVVQLPLWLLGGVFFSNQRFPGMVQGAVDLLPMSALTAGLRAIMLEGGGVGAVWAPAAALFAFGAVCLGVAVRVFRWS